MCNKEHTLISQTRKLGLNIDESMDICDAMYRAKREYIPHWLSHDEAQSILSLIDEWKIAHRDIDNLVVYIPVHWIDSGERWRYRDSGLFGIPLRLSEYVDDATVGCRIKRGTHIE